MKKIILKSVLFIVLTLAFGSCNDDDCQSCVTNTIAVSTHPSFGVVLTDSKGMTLYFFSRDTKRTSACDGDCLTSWPIFYQKTIAFTSGLEQADFSSFTRYDGKKQTTYKGYPLYYFNGDTQAGDIHGDKVDDSWFVAKPDYSLMYLKAQLIGHDGKKYKNDFSEGQGETFYLANFSNGQTLYTRSIDRFKTNTFTSEPGVNPEQWPIFNATHNILDLRLPSILNKSDFTEITSSGFAQLTYKGWPLYTFGNQSTTNRDELRGDTKGVSFPTPGEWPVANVSMAIAPN